MELNEKILRFARLCDLKIVEHVGRAGIKYYKIFTDCGVEIARIDPDCPYEDFLEQIAATTVGEVNRIYTEHDI